MILITFIRDIFRLLLNIQTQDSKPQDESYLSLLATDIILITSLFIFTFFAILTTTQETFNTHMKFQNQRKNLPEDIKKKLEFQNAMFSYFKETKDEDHWGEYVSIFHTFGPRTVKKMVRRRHKKNWSKEDIEIFYNFYVRRYFYTYVHVTLLVQILKVMNMRAVYQHLPVYMVYIIGTAAFLSSKANLCYYIKEDEIFNWYINGGGGSFIYCCLCFVIGQEVIGVGFKWLVMKLLA